MTHSFKCHGSLSLPVLRYQVHWLLTRGCSACQGDVGSGHNGGIAHWPTDAQR